jgi:hypothetical protein
LLDLLAGLERLRPVDALKGSYYAYPLVNALHILAIGTLVGAVLLMDLRILGVVRSVARGPLLRLLREAVALILPVAVVTGLALFSIRAQEYATNPAFLAKMALLALAGLNFWAFRRLDCSGSDAAAYSSAARLSAALSIVLWISVLVAGRFIGFI